MINLETMEMDGKKIHSWEVWWRTPLGLHTTLEEAQQAALSIDLPFYLIRAIPVALTENRDWYEERP